MSRKNAAKKVFACHHQLKKIVTRIEVTCYDAQGEKIVMTERFTFLPIGSLDIFTFQEEY